MPAYPIIRRRRGPTVPSPFKKTGNQTTKKNAYVSGYYVYRQDYPPLKAAQDGKMFGRTVTLQRSRTTSGSKPNWRQIIARGGNANTGLAGTFTRCWSGGGVVKASWYDVDTKHRWSESVSGDLALLQIWIPTLNSDSSLNVKAETKAAINLSKTANKFETQVMGGVILGELKETLHMLHRPADALRKGVGEYLRAVKQRSGSSGKKLTAKAKAKHLTKVASETWLEYAFGWVPLFADIADSVKAYNQINRKIETIRFGCGGDAESEIESSDSSVGWLNYCIARQQVRRSMKCHVRYTGAIRVQAATTTAEVMDRFGLNIQNFIPTAWELVPWSFLVDYFTNIGDILSYDNRVQQNIAWLVKGTEFVERSMLYVYPDSDAYKRYSKDIALEVGGGSSFAIIERRTVSRNDASMPSVSSLSFDVTVPDYWKQIANMSALIGSANAIHPQRLGR